jgi:hypothetical protein
VAVDSPEAAALVVGLDRVVEPNTPAMALTIGVNCSLEAVAAAVGNSNPPCVMDATGKNDPDVANAIPELAPLTDPGINPT